MANIFPGTALVVLIHIMGDAQRDLAGRQETKHLGGATSRSIPRFYPAMDRGGV